MYENRGLISDWDTLQLVLAIDRYGGVSGAARSLGVTHATVSRRLSKAEQEAGFQFFKRLPAGLRITEAGTSILHHAKRVELEFNALERDLMKRDAGISGQLRITMPPLMLTDDVAEDIGEFLKLHPEVKLEFVGDNNLVNLHQRVADVAIRVTEKPPETLWGRKLIGQDAGFYAQTKWLEERLRVGPILEQEVPLVSFNAWKNPVPSILRELDVSVKVVARCEDMIMAMQLAKSGVGIARMPKVLGDALEGVSRVIELPWQTYSPLWILTHPDLRKVLKVQAFMQHITAGFVKRSKYYVEPD